MDDASRLYDDYLEAVLRGEAVRPDEFLAGRTEDAELLAALGAIHRMAVGSCDATRTDELRPTVRLPAASGMPEAIGEFRLLSRLGQGGMGTVYLAEQSTLGRLVALKVIRPEHLASPTAAARFQREARAVARLRHPGIVTLFEVGEADGVRYLAMELVPGQSLAERLATARSGGPPVGRDELVGWMAATARALQAAHDEGVVHRDVKPSNIRITPEGQAVLLDFGLARRIDRDEPTITGAFLGTPAYVSPEQLTSHSKAVDGRTDVYGLGVTLYEGLLGRPPFTGSQLEQVVHQILTRPPQRPRSVDRTISRDLETIVLRALEKDPDQRYATAGALADDLEALLSFRPIAARPPGRARRLAQLVRRNPSPAAAALVVLVVLAGVAGALAWRSAAARRDRRAEAARSVEEARRRLDRYREERRSTRDLEREVERIQRRMQNDYVEPEEFARLTAHEDRIARLRREREAVLYQVFELLRIAERLDPDVAGAEEVRARLYLERWREAREQRDGVSTAFYREMLESTAAPAEILDEVRGHGRIVIESDPPGAIVHLYRYLERGEPRLVPVPVGGSGADPLEPGTWCLRVVRPTGDLAEGDLIVELAGQMIEGTVLVAGGAGPVERLDRLVSIDGRPVADVYEARTILAGRWPGPPPPDGLRRLIFERRGERFEVGSDRLAGIRLASPAEIAAAGDVDARVHRDGRIESRPLPGGLVVRATAAPLPRSSASRAGPTPLTLGGLEPGGYLVVLVAAGHRTARLAHRVDRGSDGRLSVSLWPEETAPDGFVPVADHWFSEYEVTCAEYLEFLNERQTLATIAGAGRPIRYPRNPAAVTTGHWPRRRDGRFAIPPGWSGDWPIVGIAWEDAVAYAAWRTVRARAAGLAHTYRLPTFDEWMVAAGSFDGRTYVFGDRFRTTWAKSNFSRPLAEIEAVGSFPVDESVYGCYDLCGSAFEWVDSWWQEEKGSKTYLGGAWGMADFEAYFKNGSGNGLLPTLSTDVVGFRLLLEIER